MKLLLDTTLLVDVLRGRAAAYGTLAAALNAGHELGTSAINLAEVYSGLRSHEETAAADFLATLDCFPVTASIAERGGRMRNELARRGVTIGLADAVIAAGRGERLAVRRKSDTKDGIGMAFHVP